MIQTDLNCLCPHSFHLGGVHMCSKHICHGALESGLGSSISSTDMHWVNSGNHCSSVTSNESEPASILINACHLKYDCHDLAPVSEEEDNDGIMGLWNKCEDSNAHLDQLPWRDTKNTTADIFGANSAGLLEEFDELGLSNDRSRHSRQNTNGLYIVNACDNVCTVSHDVIDQSASDLLRLPRSNSMDLDQETLPDDLYTFSHSYSNHPFCKVTPIDIGHCQDTCTCPNVNNNECLTFFGEEYDNMICSAQCYPWLTVANNVVPMSTTDDSLAHLEHPWTNDTLCPILSPMCHDIHNSIRKSDICHNHLSCMNNSSNNEIFYRRQSFQNSSTNLRSMPVCENRANIFDGDNNEDQMQVRANERVLEWLKLVTTP